MSAGVVKFTPVVKSGPLGPDHDVIFLLQAGLARSGGGVKTSAPGNYFPE